MAVDHECATPAAGQQVTGQAQVSRPVKGGRAGGESGAVSTELPLPVGRCVYPSTGEGRERGRSLLFIGTEEGVRVTWLGLC